jgi:hypothetical protein
LPPTAEASPRPLAELPRRALRAVDEGLGRFVLVGGEIRAPAAFVGGLLATAFDPRQLFDQIVVHRGI